jgi:NAD(P)-dependent dehydrogenase (short-subunit alcohol dehydrogenase family)
MELGMRDRVVLVTGASSGIGRAKACAYAREGARVALTCHRNRDGAEQTADQARAAGGETLVVPLDLGDPSSIHDAGAAG